MNLRKPPPPRELACSRRNFIWMALGAAAYAADPEEHAMLVRSKRPEDLEMPLSGFADYVTPVDHFFVRTHVYVPNVDLQDWNLKVEGELTTALALSFADIKKLPSIEFVSVLECAGNGRSFYQPPVPGAQWSYGGVGNGRWRGVRLGDVLRKAGIKDSAKEILFNGADIPIGTMRDFERSIPVKKALDPNTILAYQMNGEPLPVKHGFPLRVIVPGWASDSWVKWLTSIRVLNKEFDGFWMVNAYRAPANPVPPGTALPPEQMRPVTSVRVKSVIASPLDGAQIQLGKPVTVSGVAWSGEGGPVEQVEVSVNGGRSWQRARLENDLTRFGWRRWQFTWTPERASYYNVMARAHDRSGDTQPMVEEWNPSGYKWNVVQRIGVSALDHLPETPSKAPAPPLPAEINAPAAFKSACLVCHEDDVIRQQRLTRGQWARELDKMLSWGARVAPDQREGILDYLARTYGPRP